jgi:hypothetical protein
VYEQNFISLKNTFKFLLRQGVPYASPQNQMHLDIVDYRVFNDILFFIMSMLMLNMLKGMCFFLLSLDEAVSLCSNF